MKLSQKRKNNNKSNNKHSMITLTLMSYRKLKRRKLRSKSQSSQSKLKQNLANPVPSKILISLLSHLSYNKKIVNLKHSNRTNSSLLISGESRKKISMLRQKYKPLRQTKKASKDRS